MNRNRTVPGADVHFMVRIKRNHKQSHWMPNRNNGAQCRTDQNGFFLLYKLEVNC